MNALQWCCVVVLCAAAAAAGVASLPAAGQQDDVDVDRDERMRIVYRPTFRRPFGWRSVAKKSEETSGVVDADDQGEDGQLQQQQQQDDDDAVNRAERIWGSHNRRPGHYYKRNNEVAEVRDIQDVIIPAAQQSEPEQADNGEEVKVQRRFWPVVAKFAGQVAWKAGVNYAAKKLSKMLGKRDVTAVEKAEAAESKNELSVLSEVVQEAKEEQSVERALLAATPRNLPQLLNERVVKAEKYELPLLGFTDWLRTKHDGVVVTLTDGRRLLIIRGYEFFREKPTVVLDARVMSDNWRLLETKASVETATLGDYVRASEDSSNSVTAAVKMMALV